MTEAAKQTRAAYLREWRAKNKDKVKLYEERKWERKAREQEAAEHEKVCEG